MRNTAEISRQYEGPKKMTKITYRLTVPCNPEMKHKGDEV